MSARILIVEDEDELADFVERGLREEGFTVAHAADGEQGWEAMRYGEWDLIVLDWSLPGEDGLTILRRFRQSGGVVPVLFLTARDSVADRVRGLDGGADDYLCKPFAFVELLARVRALVRRRERVPELSLAHGGVTIDLATQRAQRDGHVLDLTAKELALLAFFLRHPGQVLSRTRIYDHVWDENFDGLSNTLEVHVMELRRKLEAYGPRVIHTMRGRGYIFDRSSPSEAP
jgi:two-component system, OmpR family, copper resistance phosphate regulon response regulator CusR